VILLALYLKVHNKIENEISDSLVVLIHGLGAPNTTWISNEISWIDLLLNDTNLTSIDVANVTYDTAHLSLGILQAMGIKSLKLSFFNKISVSKGPFTTIETLSQELKRELNTNKVKEYKRIILVGHSMGGLIGIRY
jgi:pimeloyl-ACP methyl ester carboxylesterase